MIAEATRRAAVGAVLAGVALLAAGPLAVTPAAAGSVEVQVKLPVPQKIDVTGLRRLLVGGFRGNDNPDIDVDIEYVKFLRDALRRRTTFDVIDADPPPLPEQELKDVIRNSSYWRRIAQRFTADIVVAGAAEFQRVDRSGFVSEDIISPLTGQRIRRTRYAEREGFNLAITLYFFSGASGELLYEQRLTEDATFEGLGNDALTALHQLSDRSTPEVLGVLMPREKTETRYLFVE